MRVTDRNGLLPHFHLSFILQLKHGIFDARQFSSFLHYILLFLISLNLGKGGNVIEVMAECSVYSNELLRFYSL